MGRLERTERRPPVAVLRTRRTLTPRRPALDRRAERADATTVERVSSAELPVSLDDAVLGQTARGAGRNPIDLLELDVARSDT